MDKTLARQLGRVLIAGGGRMGQAICAGLLRLDGMCPADITVANPGKAKRDAIAAGYGVRVVEHAPQGLPADTVFLAVKPAKVEALCSELASRIGSARVVSIAAGISTRAVDAALGGGHEVVRVMPNTPLLSGAGMSGVSGGEHAAAGTVQLVCDVFASLGAAVVVEEEMQDVVTALSGSGPAYFELIARAMAREGEALGLDYATSLELVLGTMRGTAVMLQQTGQDLDEAIEAVSSPGGTTVAALDAFSGAGLEAAVASGVRAAAARSKELGE